MSKRQAFFARNESRKEKGVKPFQLTWTITTKDHGKLLREFLREQQISKAALTDIKFHGGRIEVNGKEENVRYVCAEGDVVLVTFPEEKHSDAMQPEQIPLHIVYEDDHCLVINKPPFLSTIPSREHPSGSLANGLLHYYKQKGEKQTVHIVTRLDRDTSGLLLVAKHRFSHSLFSKEQQKGAVKRTYMAVVHGTVLQDEGTIHAPIGRKGDSIIERVVHPAGQHAVTHFRVKERFFDRTLVELQLETGRTHQIRVHMAHIGHPLLGDSLYGGKREFITRQALHSARLQFDHPILKEKLSFTCPLPDDMKKLVDFGKC